MVNLSKLTLRHIFQGFLIGALVISFYVLMRDVYDKSYRNINCWQFPMLLALLVETYII
jgi:hypothetical protein